ncbi:zinc finger BED domain-containing protein DAYSLEEPER-like [Cicer arietinum]|uniref:zinc finger BED domain-containing protein DAYSLEEPER-like n=1 Tax=Cicer arietinum TaxID=3827 RepID=UPI003CC57784
MGIAIVLDPRFKFKLLEYFYQKLYGSLSSIEVNIIKKLCYSLFEDYQAKNNGSVDNSMEKFNEKESNLENGNCTNFLRGYDLYVNDINDVQSKFELDLYLEETLLHRSATFDILGKWKTNGIKYPILQKITKDILTIPISTVALESAFSTGCRLLSPQ